MTGWPPPTEGSLTSPLLRSVGPTMVAIGGGHGLSGVLEAARSYAQRVTGIVTVADDGGSSGRLTTALDILPPGDMRKGLLALSPDDTVWRRLFDHRFTDTDVAGHSLGNLILAALTEELGGDFEQALLAAGYLLGARGRVLPVVRESVKIRAVIDGDDVPGQVAVGRHRGRVSRLILEPPPVANPMALDAITNADQIVIGPGSLYTSVLSCLIVDGIAEAIDASPAEIVFVMNLVTQDGETWGMSGLDHLEAFLGFSGIQRGGTLLVHDGAVVAPDGVEVVTIDEAEAGRLGWKVHRADLCDGAEWPSHQPKKLRRVLASLA